MAKPFTLLLLLAVAASQVDLYLALFIGGGGQTLSSCPIFFYGQYFNYIKVSFNNDSSVSFCFENDPSPTTRNDCLVLVNGGGASSFQVTTRTELRGGPGSDIYTLLPNIMSSSSCNHYIQMKAGGNYSMDWTLLKFDKQAVLQLKSLSAYTLNATVDVIVNSSKVASWTWPKAQSDSGVYMDISGCRESGTILAAGKMYSDPNTCTNITCDKSQVILQNVSTCDKWEVCVGNSRCQAAPAEEEAPVVCTVTASTVIDFSGKVHSVRDRCLYHVMEEFNSNFKMMALFRERRRKDYPFLDTLMIVQPSGTHFLQGGGIVDVINKSQSNRQRLKLNATAQVFNGLELSKDQTGVTAKILSTNVTIFFDGNTAHVSAPRFVKTLRGVCGNPNDTSQNTTLSAERASFNPRSCYIQLNDTVDSTIDCANVTAYCNQMQQGPFTACHNHTDPEPFIKACNDTLCKYPMVDGLNCQFFEAYAKSCSLQSNVKMGDWRSSVGCPADPKAFCLDRYCSAHEFCGEMLGSTHCLCRATFGSKYKSTNTLGEPVVCTQNSATLTLAGCLLEEKGIDYSKLHLKDKDCKGHVDEQTHMVTFSYNSSNTCGTEVKMNNSQIFYKNTIMMRNVSSDIITRSHQVFIDFSCLYAKPDMKSMSFKIKGSSVVQKIVSGFWNYTLMMNIYTDPSHTEIVTPNSELQLDQKIWVVLKTEGLDDKLLAIVTDSCWATNEPSPQASVRYDLVMNGCPNPADNTVKVEDNGQGTSNFFSFNIFQFTGKAGEIYLHCKMQLCSKQGQSCTPICSGNRRRRSARPIYEGEHEAIITIGWDN